MIAAQCFDAYKSVVSFRVPQMNAEARAMFSTGKQIAAARTLIGWKATDLAKAAGVHRNAVSYWETETSLPSRTPYAVAQMASALEAAGVEAIDMPSPGVRMIPQEPVTP